jgi:SAM-dependent methyltransferase
VDVNASPWVIRFANLVSRGGEVLDVACGSGRHARLFLARGHDVVAVDRDLSGLADLANHSHLEMVKTDLEAEALFALAHRRFAAVVVTNFLHRPLVPTLIAAVENDGVFIYETFAAGNERFGKPNNPDYLLHPGELLDAVDGRLRVVAYEDLIVEEPLPAAVQRVCAVGLDRPTPAPFELLPRPDLA